MGKNFCKVESKWCKFLRRGVCNISKDSLDNVKKCPRLEAIETVRLFDLLKEVSFNSVFTRLYHYFPDQKASEEGYRKVFSKLLTMTPQKHRLDDLYIEVEVFKENDSEFLVVGGVNILGTDETRYGIEFSSWVSWISMFITQKTLDTLSKEDIVAGCLYEMTFFGFEEHKIRTKEQQLIDAVKDAKQQYLQK